MVHDWPTACRYELCKPAVPFILHSAQVDACTSVCISCRTFNGNTLECFSSSAVETQEFSSVAIFFFSILC